jgi:hypothetical protein
VLIENLEGIKTFCVIVKIIFLNKVLIFFWETKRFQKNIFCFQCFEIIKRFFFDKIKALNPTLINNAQVAL